MTETKTETGQRYCSNLQGEVDSAALYRALADAEENPQLAEVYRRLAAVEEAHAEFWRKELARVGARLPALRAGWRTRFLIRLAHWFGPTFVLPTVVSLERADVSRYDAQPEATASGLPSAERSHSAWSRRCSRTRPEAPSVRRLRSSRAGTTASAAATRSARRCWAPTTGWSPT